MKSILRPALIAIIVFLLIFLVISLSGFEYAQINNTSTYKYTNGVFITLQTTPTPQVEVDRSEIGSTDWITAMSFTIVAIVIIPIILRRKSWSRD